MKLTYEDIVSQINRKMGWTATDSTLRADIRLAVRYSEEQLLTRTGITKREEDITITPDKERYSLPPDYNEPAKIIFFDSAGNQLEAENVEFEHFITLKIQSNTTERLSSDEIRLSGNDIKDIQTNARYYERIIYSIHFTDGGTFELGVKPPVSATCRVYFSCVPIDNVFASLKRTPVLPEQHHIYIVYGATAYLAENEAAKKLREREFEFSNFYSRLAKEMKALFENQVAEVGASAQKQPEPAIIRSFSWFDNPRKYRSSR